MGIHVDSFLLSKPQSSVVTRDFSPEAFASFCEGREFTHKRQLVTTALLKLVVVLCRSTLMKRRPSPTGPSSMRVLPKQEVQEVVTSRAGVHRSPFQPLC